MRTYENYHFLLQDLWPYGLVFTRLLLLVLLVPGIGSQIISSFTRILFTLGICVCITPALISNGALPTMPVSGVLLLYEGVIGVFLGMFIRISIQMLEVSGAIISHQAALSNVFVNQPVADEQNSLPGMFLYIAMIALLFVSDFHHTVFTAIVESYRYFPPGGELFVEDMLQTVLELTQKGFYVAVQITSPFLIFGTIFFTVIGLINRLMPQIQIFFISQPLDILVSLVIFMAAINNIFATYIQFLFETFNQLAH